MRNFILFFLFSLLLFTGCKTTKNASSTSSTVSISSKKLSKKIIEEKFNFNYLSAKARVNFDDGKMNQSFTANIRIKNNETLWMSLTGPFGIEGGRVLITQDSIKIMDRLNKKYINEPISYLYNFVPFKIDLVLFQNILVGNPLEVDLEKQAISSGDGNYIASGRLGDVSLIYTILSSIFKYKTVSATNNFQNLILDFDDYRAIENQKFSFKRNIQIFDSERNVNIDLGFNRLKIEDNLDFPFNVPDRFNSAE